MKLPAEIKSLFEHRHSRAVVVGVLILALIAVLQVLRSRQLQPMVPLVESAKVCEADVQRMQLALGRAGISGSSIENGTLLVPKNKKESCLKAIAEFDAVPEFLRDQEEETPVISPFLSRSQQQRIAQAEKKREIRDMVKRLPFVSQAWLEMDSDGSNSMFTAGERSAVVSIEPTGDIALDVQQVSTVREMIAGAVVGLEPTDVVVIDVAEGYAHRGQAESGITVTPITERPAFEQQVWYSKRIKHALASFGDIDVDVQVDLVPVQQRRPVVQLAAARKPVTPPGALKQSSGVIGTNSTASIFVEEAEKPKVEVVPVVAEVDVPSFESNVAVTLAIPHETAVKYGARRKKKGKGNRPVINLDKFKHDLVAAVRPVLPANSFAQGKAFPVSFKVLEREVVEVQETARQAELRQFLLRHWPSMAVLAIGVILLSTMMQSQPETRSPTEESDDEVILSIDSTQVEAASQAEPDAPLPEVAIAQPEDYARREAEQRLHKMVDQDPDSAAKVIESWIRNAG